jgi:hypothetical protein
MYNPDLKLYAIAALPVLLEKSHGSTAVEQIAKRAFDIAQAMCDEAQKREEARR